MLNPEIERRLQGLLHAYHEGSLTRDEIGLQIGCLALNSSLAAVLRRVPLELRDAVRAGLARENRWLAGHECLEPEPSPLQPQLDYYQSVARIFPWPAFACMVCLPSRGETEWTVRLVRRKKGEWGLDLVVATEMISGAPDPTSISVHRHEASLPEELSKLLWTAWLSMVLRTRYAEPVYGRGVLDGTAYHFSVWSDSVISGRISGCTHSPNPETAPGRMVRSGRLLRAYIETATGERTVPQAAALGRIEGKLIHELHWLRDLPLPPFATLPSDFPS